jgi:hypothetical protein
LVSGVALAAAGSIVLARLTSAQGHRRVEIAPALGGFASFGGVPMPYLQACVTGRSCELASFKEARTVAVGGRVTAWIGNRVAIEGAGWYGPGHVADATHYDTTSYPGGTNNEGGHGGTFLATVRAVANVAPGPTASVLVMAGPAISHRFGVGWALWKNPTSGGGAFGIGLDIHPSHGLGMRAAIEDYVYTFDSPDPRFISSESHHDFVFSLSIGPTFGQRRARR